MPTSDHLPAILRESLACPLDHAELLAEGDVLVCPTCHRRFRVDEDGVPDMVVEG